MNSIRVTLLLAHRIALLQHFVWWRWGDSLLLLLVLWNLWQIKTVLPITFRYKPFNVKGCSSYTFGWYMKALFGSILTGLLIPWHKQAEGGKSDIGSQLQWLPSPDPMCLGVRESTHPLHGWPEWELFTGWRPGSRALEGTLDAGFLLLLLLGSLRPCLRGWYHPH